MAGVVVSGLEFAHPGCAPLFFDVGFTVGAGERAALVGANGTGKTALLRALAGELEPDEGQVAIAGTALYMPQDVGMAAPGQSVRAMLVEASPPALRAAGRELLAAEAAVAEGGMRLAEAITTWGDLGGYALEQRWDAAARRVVRSGLDDLGERRAADLSGGERKRLVLEVLLRSDADVLLLDEPDNYLDIPARRWLEDELRATPKTVLFVTHDRTLLAAVATKVVTLEGSACWTHGGGWAGYPEARRRRQELMGDERRRWQDEERRLYRHMKILKQRAAVNFKNASKANAAETRWKRFAEAGPPPPPVRDESIAVRLQGADSARRTLRIDGVSAGTLFEPFSDDVYFGERIGLVGSNGTGKTHLLDILADPGRATTGSVAYGPRTSVGRFTQVNDRPDFAGRTPLDIVAERTGEEERAMKALGRYGLAGAARREFETLSGGQRARLEVLCLDVEGHNVILLDEPTDNLDVASAEALEAALDRFQGTVVAVSHDRAFLARMTRFLLIADDGSVFALPDLDVALEALGAPDDVHELRHARLLA